MAASIPSSFKNKNINELTEFGKKYFFKIAIRNIRFVCTFVIVTGFS
jgi:hypothetical protein